MALTDGVTLYFMGLLSPAEAHPSQQEVSEDAFLFWSLFVQFLIGDGRQTQFRDSVVTPYEWNEQLWLLGLQFLQFRFKVYLLTVLGDNA